MFRTARILLGAFATYAKIGWWGLVLPRVREHLVVAQAIVLSDDGVLLAVRSDLLGWELSGGTVEKDEAPETAVCREVREETGLIVEVDRHVGDYERTGFRPHTAKVYLCRPVGGVMKSNWETLELRWFMLDALPETLFAWYREPLRDAFSESVELPVSKCNHQGLADVMEAIRIDLRMRFSDDRRY